MSLLQILILAFLVTLLWGGWGWGRVSPDGAWIGAWSPAGLVIVILLVLLLTGRLR